MAKVKVVPSGVHAVFAVDPGNTTGIAAGYVELQPTLKETLATLTRGKAAEVGGGWLFQGRELSRLIKRFVFSANVEERLPIDHIHIVFEDFILRRRQEGGATGNLTSIWVMAAAVGSLKRDELDIAYQQPSSAKSKATDERLKMWGLWEKGSAHKRDAWRHFALRVDGLIDL